MTADSHKKFLFDTDFAPEAADAKAQLEKDIQAELEAELALAEASEESLEEILPTFSEADVQTARDEGFQAGHTQASQDLTTTLEQRLANAMDAINTQIANLFDAFAHDKEEHSRDAVAVATVIVRKLFPALNMDTAMAEIEHMIVEAMQRTSGTPTLVVRVPPEIHESVESKANELAALRGREGTISVMADGGMNEGDVAVEWDGGGMIRDTHAMWQEIDEIIERNLGSKRANGHNEQPQPSASPPHPPEPTATLAPEAMPEMAQEVVNEAVVEENEEIAPESPPQSERAAEPGVDTDMQDEPTLAQAAPAEQNEEQGQAEPGPTQDEAPSNGTPDDAEHEG